MKLYLIMSQSPASDKETKRTLKSSSASALSRDSAHGPADWDTVGKGKKGVSLQLTMIA